MPEPAMPAMRSRSLLAGPDSRRVLFLVTEDWYFLSHRLPLALALINQGVEVWLMARFSEHRERIEALGIRTIHWNVSRGGIAPAGEFRSLLQVFAALRRIRPHLVHAVALKPSVLGGVATRLLRVPTVFAVAGLGHVFISRSVRMRLIRELMLVICRIGMRSARALTIFQNEDDRSVFVRRGIVKKDRTVLIPGVGISLDDFCMVDEPGGLPTVLMLSRLLWEKGVREFLEAASIVKQRGYDSRWVIVGPIDHESHDAVPAAEVQKWQDSGIVEWWGEQKEISALISRCNIFVLPSYREGLPRAVLEAAASGRAVVATNVPGCRDAVEDGRTGILVPPRDATAVADAVIRLIQQPELRRRMGLAGREMCSQRFSLSQIVDATLRTYELLGLELTDAPVDCGANLQPSNDNRPRS